jgi:hypothetical protein
MAAMCFHWMEMPMKMTMEIGSWRFDGTDLGNCFVAF